MVGVLPHCEALWWLLTFLVCKKKKKNPQNIQEILDVTQHARSSCPNVLQVGFYKFEGLARRQWQHCCFPKVTSSVAGGSSAGSSEQWLPPHFVSPQLSCQESIGDHNVGSAAGRSVPRLPCKYFIPDSRQGAFKDVCWTMLPSCCPLEVTGLAF